MQASVRQACRTPDGAPVHCERHRPEQTTLRRLDKQHAATIGLQITGHRHDDRGVLQLAQAWEQLRPASGTWSRP